MANIAALLVRLVAIVALAWTVAAPAPAAPTPRTESTVTPGQIRGEDISWPNCPKGEGIPSRRSPGEPMPKPTAAFVVVGVTNGPGFHPNPCLARQLSWVSRHHRSLGAYAMTTYPTAGEIKRFHAAGPFAATSTLGRLRNAGYAEATANLRLMASVAMTVPMIWVDVEPYPTAPWTHRHRNNRAVISGVIRAYRHAGLPVGIYTYASGWRQVVGGWRLRQRPTWNTVGPRGRSHAAASCSHGPSGGRTWLAQWYTTHRDFDLVCPAATHRLSALLAAPAS